MTLFNCLMQYASSKPDALAYVFLNADGTRTERNYFDLCVRVKSVAASIQARARPGERAILLYSPGMDFIESILACFACGVVAVPIQTIQNNRSTLRLRSVLADAQCQLVLTDKTNMDKVRRFSPELIVSSSKLIWLETDEEIKERSADYKHCQPAPNDLAFLQYTSGSTGAPKGVMVGHDNIMSNQSIIQSAFEHDESTRMIGWLPLYHDMGLIGNTLQPLYLGACAVLFAPMTFLTSPITWLESISQWRGTTSGAPSFAYELCAKRITDEEMQGLDLSSWAVAYNGAEPVRADVIDEFSRRFAPYGFRKEAFYPCYGMAETTLFIAGGKPGQPIAELPVDRELLKLNQVAESTQSQYRLVGCGRVRGDFAVVIVSNEGGQTLPDGEVGEVWLSGSSVTQGYWGQPELTEKTFQAYTQDGHGPFLRTGDLGFLRDGELFITGRIKDVIIVRGQNHYPTDLEATLIHNDEHWLREGCVAVFTIEKAGVTQLVAVAEIQRKQVRNYSVDRMNEIKARARKSISEQHGLRLFDLVLIRPATLPKTSSGKVQRSLCRTLYDTDALKRLTDRVMDEPQQTVLAEG